eukprot:CAMPEP_0205811222 /NCGR_PEP_ID=MMETSP0205-20121125/15395_1 /ASSEMBLY_ACC=CAM_ASM_000278 /TAXON_ID=36767 /ORGANISM="Euplotes focardii, Strain TN1" /LENGTH=62 /DNA_ID=CAMNT_0053090123 /DNA_START=540 /DNA_END=725 /DNA_ORIENTATION=-
MEQAGEEKVHDIMHLEAKKEALLLEIKDLEYQVFKLKDERDYLEVEKISEYYLQSHTKDKDV